MVKEEQDTVEGSPKIFVTGIGADTSKSVLNTFFSKHGKVADVIYKFGTDGKRIKEVAYILFESEESVKKWLEEKTVTIDEKKVEIKKTSAGDGQKEDEPLLAVPKAALKCYVCKREKFPSVEAYLNHKKGKQHQAVYKIFKAKSSSVLQLLKAEAKLAADRAYDMIWMKKNPKFNHLCELCQCNIVCKPEKHELSVEHKMVKNYNNLKCCEFSFTDRHKYEAHLLTLSHLKLTYEKDQKKKDDIDDGRPNMKKAIDLYKQCDADLKELKDTYGELDLNAELPPFDSKTPLGLNYIVKKINYHCICCDQKFFAHLNLVEPHCRSYNHYTHMTDYIVGVDKKIAQKRKNEEGEGEVRPNKKKNDVVKKEVNKDGEDEDSTLNKSAKVKGSDIKRKVKEEADDDDDDDDEEEDEEMDTLDKSNDDEEDVDQSESKDLDEEQGGDDEEQEDDDEEQEEGDEEQEEGDEDQDEGEEVGEEEAAEDQEEAAEDSDVQEAKEEDDDEQMQSDEEEKVTTPTAEKKIDENPAEDTDEDKEEEVAEESPKPTRGTPRGRRARGRGRGRGLKR